MFTRCLPTSQIKIIELSLSIFVLNLELQWFLKVEIRRLGRDIYCVEKNLNWYFKGY